jgi:error-prone DNA polymerase
MRSALKVDCLALGMLTAIRKSLEFIGTRKGYVLEMQDIPAEDTETYDMVCQADTVGVFQIESRRDPAARARNARRSCS